MTEQSKILTLSSQPSGGVGMAVYITEPKNKIESEPSYEEWKLINKYKKAYSDLDSGKRIPTTALQKHFVDVAHGLAEPNTKHEFAYLKWKKLKERERDELRGAQKRKTAKSKETYKGKNDAKNSKKHISFRQKPVEFSSNDQCLGCRAKIPSERLRVVPGTRYCAQCAESFSPNYKRYVTETWGTRQDWKRDRSSWKKR